MLIDHCGDAAVFVPPPVEELTPEERGRLRSRLVGVVESWRGAMEIGMRVATLCQHRDAAGIASGDGVTWFRAGGAPVMVGVTSPAAVGLICVNLGEDVPEKPDTRLTQLDLALLDAWADRAVRDLVAALNAGSAGEILRRIDAPGEIAAEWGPVVSAELTFAGEMPAGVIAIGESVAHRHTRATRGPVTTLGDRPELLWQAKVTVEAAITAEPVPLPELLTLECGDVLLLGQKTALGAALSAGETVVAEGRPGAREGLRAVRIKGAVLTDREDGLGETSDGF
ncbi:MAG: FliM/FliN family flagellar motor switch protein [Armatimonadota bacterium]